MKTLSGIMMALVMLVAAGCAGGVGPTTMAPTVDITGKWVGSWVATNPALGSGAIERMTYDGSYNVSPRNLPDGRGFVFVRRDGGRFNIALQDFGTRQVQILTQGSLDESPSVAPNGKLIIYASETGGRGILAAVSSDGRVKQRLTAAASDVREPAWGPLLK